MPYPSEHACRIRQPGDFEEGSFRRITQGKLSIIIGRLKGKTTTTAQARRYPKGKWSEAEARADCAEAGGSFEPAVSGEAQEMVKEMDYLDPEDNAMIRVGEE